MRVRLTIVHTPLKEMQMKKLVIILAIIVLAGTLLTACQSAATTAPVSPTQAARKDRNSCLSGGCRVRMCHDRFTI